MTQLRGRETHGRGPIWMPSRSHPTLLETSTWTGKRLRACRTEPDLVAVYESPDGSLALLLRHTVVPLAEERRLWRKATRRAAGAIIGRLRSADLKARLVVLQWLPLDEVARILRHWTCRYNGDAERRARIAQVVERHLMDHAFLASLHAIKRGANGRSPAGTRP